jgi:hypothetical protein
MRSAIIIATKYTDSDHRLDSQCALTVNVPGDPVDNQLPLKDI